MGIADRIGDRLTEADARFELSLLYYELNRFNDSVEHAEKALHIYTLVGDPRAIQIRNNLDRWMSVN